MRILVTGITGRVGANLARRFIDNGYDVRGFVWPGDPASATVKSLGAELFEGDLANYSDVARSVEGCEGIFHLGAAFQAGGPFTPEQYFDINIKGVFNILEAAQGLSASLKHLIWASTDATMFKYPPEGIEVPIREDSLPLVSTDWYGYSKVLGEHLVDRYVRAAYVPATIFRFANVWGAGEILDWPQFYVNTFLKRFENRQDDEGKATFKALEAANAEPNKLLIACDRNGRPWKKHSVEVRDLVHGFEAAFSKPSTFGKTYQLAAPGPFTWDAAVPYLANALERPFTRMDLPTTPTFYEYDMSAAREDFGYAPAIGIEETVDEAVAYQEGDSDAVIARGE